MIERSVTGVVVGQFRHGEVMFAGGRQSRYHIVIMGVAKPSSNSVAGHLFGQLTHEGRRPVFTLPGDDPLVQEAITNLGNSIVCRHEAAVTFAAQAAGRVADLGICAVAHGPGMTASVTGLAAAKLERDPVVIVCSQLAQAASSTQHAYIPAESLVPFAKCVVEIGSDGKPFAVESLVAEAQREPAGPVVVSLPEDFSGSSIENIRLRYLSSPRPARLDPLLSEVQNAADFIRRADNPYAILGAGVVRAGASREVLRFVTTHTAGALTTYNAKGLLGRTRDRCACRHIKNVHELAPDVDLWVLIGVDSTEGLPPVWESAPCIHIIDAVPFEEARCTVMGRIAASVVGIGTLLGKPRSHPTEPMLRAPPRHPIELLAAQISGFPGRITVDTGLFKHALGVWAAVDEPNRILFTNGLSVMGWALGAAIGVTASTGEPTLAVLGDGGLSAAITELFTIRQFGLPVSLLVVKDGFFGMIRHRQAEVLGIPVGGVQLDSPELRAIASAFDLEYVRFTAENGPEWGRMLMRAAESQTLIEFCVDYSGFMTPVAR